MLTLTTTSQIIEVTTAQATAVDVSVSFADHTTSGAVLDDQQTLITTATTTTILAAPAASTQRQVKMISILNTGVSSNLITVKKDISATEYDLISVTLGVSERMEYLDGRGWAVYNNQGSIKTAQNQGNAPISSGWSLSVLASDVTNNNAVANSIADVTGLSFAVTAGNRYAFRFVIAYTSAAATTGARWTINGPSVTSLSYNSRYTLTATTETVNYATAYDIPAASNASSLTAGNRALIEGIIQPSANGTVIARFASEVASSAIVALGNRSYVEYIQLA